MMDAPAATTLANGPTSSRRMFRFRCTMIWSPERTGMCAHWASAEVRFIVTSLPTSAIDGQKQIYCARGEMENRIKEQQLHLFADRTSAHTMRANQVRLYFSSIAYVLLEALRRLGLAGTELAEAQCQTGRLRQERVAERVPPENASLREALCFGPGHEVFAFN